MGAIKDITDLTIKLLESKDARKFSGEIIKIQSLTAALQSEQAVVIEKNAELLSQNLALKQQVSELEKKITHMEDAHAKTIETLRGQTPPAATNLPQPDIDLMLQIARAGGKMIFQRLPNNLRLRAERLKDLGYLANGAYRPPDIEIKLTSKAREFLEKTGLL